MKNGLFRMPSNISLMLLFFDVLNFSSILSNLLIISIKIVLI
jgi:hypothetical protein